MKDNVTYHQQESKVVKVNVSQGTTFDSMVSTPPPVKAPTANPQPVTTPAPAEMTALARRLARTSWLKAEDAATALLKRLKVDASHVDEAK